MSNSSKRILLSTFLLLLPILAYLYFVRQLSFTQDDAYITYRYVANYLNGDGLVFNIGERVEGFTNFGWTVLLILVGGFKGDYIAFSKILGTIFGAGVIVVTFLTARRLISSKNYWFSFLPPFLLGANMALAYWSQSGLETAAFAFMAALSVYFYLTKSRWLILALTLAVWTRPEGALVAIILILTEGIVEKKLPRYSFSCALIAFILSIPFVLFKYFYYGSILPNPFYAKTGMSLEQVQAGLEYTGLFLKHYGFYGAGIILPILFWKKLDTNLKSVLIFTCAYILYVILIGGDVLKVHRFFLPIFGLSAILISAVIRVMSQRLSLQARALVSFSLFIFLISATYMLPMDHIKLYLDREQGLVTSMSFLATNIKKTDSSNFTAAVSTIGIFSHLLLGHQVTDMLGLTDSTIARHSQSKNEEFETTWRERNYNAEYVLSCKPDYIVFSTGVKPSAPAEQALLIYSQFVENYVSLTWYQPKHENETIDLFGFAFKKIRDFGGRIVPTYPAKYVHHYKKMCDFSTKRMYREAIQQCDSAIAISPKPFLGDMIVEDAYCWRELRQRDTANALLKLALSQDSMVVRAHKLLYINAVETGDSNQAHYHRDMIKQITPWYWPYLEADINRAISGSKAR